MQKIIETKSRTIIHHLLPFQEPIKSEIKLLKNAVSQSPNFKKPHARTTEMAQLTMEELDRITIHDLWITACVLHPGLSDLPYISSPHVTNEEWKRNGFFMIRSMMDTYRTDGAAVEDANA